MNRRRNPASRPLVARWSNDRPPYSGVVGAGAAGDGVFGWKPGAQPSLDRVCTIVLRSTVAKKRKRVRLSQGKRGRRKPRKRVRVKQRILKALAKMASREEEGLTYIIHLAFKHYAKKVRKRKSAALRKKNRAARAKSQHQREH